MSQLGMTQMINILCDGFRDSREYLEELKNQKINSITFDGDSTVRIETDLGRYSIWDDGQSCCEHRYMTTDDDVSSFNDSIFLDMLLKDAPDIEDKYQVHDVQFLEIITSKGSLTFATHNEHNGYYSGFSIKIKRSGGPR